MSADGTSSQALRASSLKELAEHELEIVKRINGTPNGGRLLMLDPQRLLRELGVEVSARALEEWESEYPEFFARIGREHMYDLASKSHHGDEVVINVKGLFRKGCGCK